MPTLHAACAIFKTVLRPSLDEDVFFSCNNCPVSCSTPWLSTEDGQRVTNGFQADKVNQIQETPAMFLSFGVDFLASVVKIHNTRANKECDLRKAL